MDNGEHVITFFMFELGDRLQRCNHDDKRVKLGQICNITEGYKDAAYMLSDFKISHIPRVQNGNSDFLAKIVRSFHRNSVTLVVLFLTISSLNNRIVVRCKKKKQDLMTC